MVDAVGKRLCTFNDRLDFLLGADVRVALVGDEDCHDNLGEWIKGQRVLQCRPAVCLLHMQVRIALDRAMDNPPTIELPNASEHNI